MISRLILYLFLLLTIFSCKNHEVKSHKKTDSKIAIPKGNSVKKTEVQALKPVFGYRFVITGDFNGDGKKEHLTEHFFSGIDHKETNKFYENDSYDTLVYFVNKKKTYSFLSCSDKSIRPLTISPKPQLGLAFLKNEGDLDGDGGDEIAYVVDWADWSNLNTWSIMTYKNGKWKDLYYFGIWDWQLPDLPQTWNNYGPFGRQDKVINSTNDTANRKIEENLKNFKGLVKKIAKNKIQIIYMTEDADMDTATVNLASRFKKKVPIKHKNY